MSRVTLFFRAGAMAALYQLLALILIGIGVAAFAASGLVSGPGSGHIPRALTANDAFTRMAPSR